MCRSRIDEIDSEIVSLIAERTCLAQKLGKIKSQTNSPVYCPKREKEVYQNIEALRQKKLELKNFSASLTLRAIYREIMSFAVKMEEGAKIIYLGPPASFSHLALYDRFGLNAKTDPVESIQEVFHEVESTEDYVLGIVPVENSTGGVIGITLDNLIRSDLQIYAEHYLRVRHHLLHAEKVDISSIQRLYLMPAVYEQCREWIHKYLDISKIEVIETASSAAAALEASEKKNGAAVASETAAETYNLQFISKNIQDTSNNITRFFILGKDQCSPTGDDKTSIVFSLSDFPGSLSEVLRLFEKRGINMSRIESRSSKRMFGEYNFFLDLEGHKKDKGIKELLKKIQRKSSFFKILGSYPKMPLPS